MPVVPLSDGMSRVLDALEPPDPSSTPPDQFQLWSRQPAPVKRTDAAYGTYDRPSMDPGDRDKMIRTLAGEAGGEPSLGQAAVAHVIMNRVADGGYGQGISGVVTAPVKPGSSYHQFSVWNAPGMQDSSATTHNIKPGSPDYDRIGNIVDRVYDGSIPDPTGGATHYYAPRSMPGGRAPDWAGPLAKLNDVTIGNQRFVGLSQGPGQSTPPQIAGGYFDVGQGGA